MAGESINIKTDSLSATTLKIKSISIDGLTISKNTDTSFGGLTFNTPITFKDNTKFDKYSTITFDSNTNTLFYGSVSIIGNNNAMLVKSSNIGTYGGLDIGYGSGSYGTKTTFYGCVDFTNATIIGLNSTSTSSGCGSTTTGSTTGSWNGGTVTGSANFSGSIVFYNSGEQLSVDFNYGTKTTFNTSQYNTQLATFDTVNRNIIFGYGTSNSSETRVLFYGCVDFSSAAIIGLTSNTSGGVIGTTSSINGQSLFYGSSASWGMLKIGNNGSTSANTPSQYTGYSSTEFYGCVRFINSYVEMSNINLANEPISFNYGSINLMLFNGLNIKMYKTPQIKDSSSDAFYTLKLYIERVVAGSSV